MSDPEAVVLRDPRVARLQDVTAHGDIAFDVPFMSQIAEDLWQGGCAEGLALPADIDHVLSLYTAERYVVQHRLRSQLSVVMEDDLGELDSEQVVAIAAWVNNCLRTGPTLVHCQAGLNRSGLIIATSLMLKGIDAQAAIALLRARRSPAALCNPSFEKWLLKYPVPPIPGPRYKFD